MLVSRLRSDHADYAGFAVSAVSSHTERVTAETQAPLVRTRVKFDILFGKWLWISWFAGSRLHGWADTKELAEQAASTAFTQ